MLTHDGRQLKLTTPLGRDFLLIKDFRVTEEISTLYRIELELLHEERESGEEPTYLAPEKVLGQPFALEIVLRDDTKRYFHGIVSEFSQGNRDERFSFYQATLVPSAWLLTQKTQSRIFQQMSVPDILREVLQGFDIAFQIEGTFEPRNYCVQYRETDFDFASRLMEEEGIYYFFEHTPNAHKMIVANTPQSHADCPHKHELPFAQKVERTDDFYAAVETWYLANRLQTGKFTLCDFNFQLPSKNLEAQHQSRFNAGGNQNLESYDFPAGYAKRFDGITREGGEQNGELQKLFTDNRRTTEIFQQQLDTIYKTTRATSDCCSLTAGYRFKLENHPNRDENGLHVLTKIEHHGAQSPDYVTGETAGIGYRNEFSCIPFGANHAPFRPMRRTPKPFVRGTQTAFVVGPAGEEIFTDKYGRVKVAFHWDRLGAADASASCWVRVAQSWAGKNWGTMFIPRVGMEVVVDFLEGDPDQPIIVGCVYNAEAMPPYELPKEMTKATIKTDSTKGGKGFNELRFEDKKGSEQIFIHGEKDLDVRIKNDRREWTGNDAHTVVKRDRREKVERDAHKIVKRDEIEQIERDSHITIDGKQAVKISGSQSLEISGSVGEKVGGSKSEEISGALYLKGMNVVIEAMTGLTLKVGGNFVNINAGGVQINGTMIMLNSGGAALTGTANNLVSPLKPAVADNADDDKPGSKLKLERASEARREKTHREDKEKKSWIKIKLVDEAGKGVAGESYQIKTPDGRTASGTLDEKGEAHIKNIEAGNCQVTFPNLDQDAWEEG